MSPMEVRRVPCPDLMATQVRALARQESKVSLPSCVGSCSRRRTPGLPQHRLDVPRVRQLCEVFVEARPESGALIGRLGRRGAIVARDHARCRAGPPRVRKCPPSIRLRAVRERLP